MSDRAERGIRAAAVVAGLLALLALVGLASGSGRPESAGTTDIGAVAEIRDITLSVGLTLYAIALAAIAWAVWRYRARGDRLPERRGVLQLIVFMILVGVAVWVFRHQAQLTRAEPEERAFGPQVVEAQPPRPTPQPARIPPAEFRWDVAIAVGAAVAAAAAGIAFVLARRRRADGEAPYDEAAAELTAVVEGTLADLHREGDARRAVIAAYAQMERVLARHGMARRAAEAPFEYLARILSELRVRASSVLALTELFERARFSPHVIDAAMRDEAIEALGAVRDDLRTAA